MEGDLFKALMSVGSGGLVASIIFYFYREKATALDKAETKIDGLQKTIVDMLKAQIDTEPARRETLSTIAKSLVDTNTFLKERLK